MNGKSKFLVNILVFVIAILFFSSFLGQSVNVNFEEDELILSAPEDTSLTIAYGQIDTMELVETFDPGTALSGDENRKCRWGEWESDVWGRYTQYTLKKVAPVILLATSDGEIVVFNYESEEATTSMHQMFTELLAHYEG